jgi:hypothetical protein
MDPYVRGEQVTEWLEGLSLSPYNLNAIGSIAHTTAIDKGWWTPERAKSPLECLMLVVTEVAEAAEDVRNGKMDFAYTYNSDGRTDLPAVRHALSGGLEVCVERPGIDRPRMQWIPLTPDLGRVLGYDVKPIGLPSELADIIIRVLDLAASLDIDMDKAVIEKMQHNATRPARHGGKLA